MVFGLAKGLLIVPVGMESQSCQRRFISAKSWHRGMRKECLKYFDQFSEIALLLLVSVDLGDI